MIDKVGIPCINNGIDEIVSRCNQAYEEFNRLSACTTDTKLAEAARKAIEATKEYSLMYENAAAILYMRQQDGCNTVACKELKKCKRVRGINRHM